MNNNEPNKIVSKLFKKYTELRCSNDNVIADEKKYWNEVAALKNECAAIVRVVGAIEVMSKNSLIKLVTMQSTHLFIANHSLYIAFSKAADDMSL